MLVDVIRLRERGRRLRPKELAPAVRGHLQIETKAPMQTSFRRDVLCASLSAARGANGTMAGVLLPLADVRLLRVADGVLTLIGIELSAEPVEGGHRITESVQIWRCTLVVSPVAGTSVAVRPTAGAAA